MQLLIFHDTLCLQSYEDENLADVDPSLAAFQDDEDDIDLLNDDTFGSGAVGKNTISYFNLM